MWVKYMLYFQLGYFLVSKRSNFYDTFVSQDMLYCFLEVLYDSYVNLDLVILPK